MANRPTDRSQALTATSGAIADSLNLPRSNETIATRPDQERFLQRRGWLASIRAAVPKCPSATQRLRPVQPTKAGRSQPRAGEDAWDAGLECVSAVPATGSCSFSSARSGDRAVQAAEPNARRSEAQRALAALVAKVSDGRITSTAKTLGRLDDSWIEHVEGSRSPTTVRYADV